MKKESAATTQRAYYAATASQYDQMHLLESEQEYALAQLTGILGYYSLKSLLDVGAGTGRVLRHAKQHLQSTRVMGVEPVTELREVAYKNGIKETELIDGDALALPFESESWDIVSAFGILHHIQRPNAAVAEMCRVAKYGIFLSDLNNYGCGSFPQRALAQILRSLGLWRAFQYVKNGGKLEKYSQGDGIHYSYSLFDSLATIKGKFPQLYLSNTKGSSSNLYRACSHVSVFAVKSVEQLEALNPHSAALHEGE